MNAVLAVCAARREGHQLAIRGPENQIDVVHARWNALVLATKCGFNAEQALISDVGYFLSIRRPRWPACLALERLRDALQWPHLPGGGFEFHIVRIVIRKSRSKRQLSATGHPQSIAMFP